MSTMILKVLFVQRKESYPGQYAPEAVAITDEFSEEENPRCFDEECIAALTNLADEICGHAVVEIEVDQDAIRRACEPRPRVVGKVAGTGGEGEKK